MLFRAICLLRVWFDFNLSSAWFRLQVFFMKKENTSQSQKQICGGSKLESTNIQKKKERMGKNYKAAKPGDKDYPKQGALKKAQANEEEWDG